MKSLRNRCLAGVATVLAGIGMSSHALPVTVSQASPAATFSWSYDTGSSLLTGSASMTITGWGNSLLELTVSLSNTAQTPGARLTAFAFGVGPDATSVGFSDDADAGMVNGAFASGTLPAHAAGVEVCVFSGNSCSAGGNGGIDAGASDTFRVLLGGSWDDSVNIDPIGLRYLTGSGAFTFPGDGTGSRSSTGGSGGAVGTSAVDGSVPEPASTALVGLSLGLLGLRSARRRKTAG